MGDPFDREFADSLRKSDRKVSLDWDEVKPALRQKLRCQSDRVLRRQLVLGLVAAFLCGCVMYQMPKVFRSIDRSQFVQIEDSNQELNSFDFGKELESVLEAKQLANLERQLETVKRKLKKLDDVRAEQRLAILKEVVSRTELNQQAIAAYHF